FSGKTCSFSGSGSVEMAGMGGEAKKYDCTVSGTVDANKTANVTVNIPAVMGGSTIVFTTGTAPADYYIADRYQGSLAMSVMGKPYGEPADVTITLEASGKNSVTVKLPAVGEGRMALPALDIADVAVNASDYNTFTLAETSFEQTVDSLHCTGTVKGSVVDGKLTLNYSVKPGAMPMNIDFVFTTKDAESKKILAKLEF
ncbi:MAG: calycin-like domain-containing protein, partial [Bacteroidales bacterium]|nr:calycin-like domain-containing protein [Bacteroidales bacterium]